MPNGDLSIKPIGNNLLRIISKNRNYIGVKNTVKISKNQTYSTYVMILDSDYNRAIVKSNIELFFFTIVLLLFVFLGCSFFSQRYLSPILKGLEQLRKDNKNSMRYDVLRQLPAARPDPVYLPNQLDCVFDCSRARKRTKILIFILFHLA